MSDEKLPQDGMEDYEADIISLLDEEGEEHIFEVLDAADIGDVHYLAVVPHAEDPITLLEEDAELLIFRVGEEDGEEVLDFVEDEAELEKVSSVFAERLSELYDIDVEGWGEEG